MTSLISQINWFNGIRFVGYQNKKGGKGLVPDIPKSQTLSSLTPSKESL